jgi:hypothetical protein
MRLRVALLLLAGCDAGGAYMYTGHAYDPNRDCLGGLLELDVLEGTDPGATCGPKCIAGKDQDGGVVVYMSTMCGPAPYNADVTGSSPRCTGAFAAQIRGDYCLDGGGSTNPPPEAGSDVGAD